MAVLTTFSQPAAITRISRELSLLSRVGYRKDGSFERVAFTRRDHRARSVLASLMRDA